VPELRLVPSALRLSALVGGLVALVSIAAARPSTTAADVAASLAPGRHAGAAALPAATHTVADARGAPNGTVVTVSGTAVTGSAFHDGGGYVVDATGGIAVLVSDGEFPAGAAVTASGPVGDRFGQRTVRVDASDLVVSSSCAAPPSPTAATVNAVAEGYEGQLVAVSVVVEAAPVALSAGLAFDVRDATGGGRVIVWNSTGIDTSTWAPGTRLDLVGVVGQRDSSGTASAGYRIQPRSSADVRAVVGPPASTPTPRPTPSPSRTASPTPTPAPDTGAGRVTVAEARAAAPGTRLTVRAVVTLPPGIVDPETAVIQQDGAAIVLRGDLPPLRSGDLVEATGTRSTKAGMETLRISGEVTVLGSGAAPTAASLRTGDIGEAVEAVRVRVEGTLPRSARRAASGTVSFDVDDGTGPVRVVLPAALAADDGPLVAGAVVTVTAVVGQETTGAEPHAGYRLWPSSPGAVTLRSAADPTIDPLGESEGEDRAPATGTGAHSGSGGVGSGLDGVGTETLRIGATLVVGTWPEVGVGGLLWDGARLVAIDPASSSAFASLGTAPVPVEVVGLRAAGTHETTGLPMVILDGGSVAVGSHAVAPPASSIPPTGATWATVVGDVQAVGRTHVLASEDTRVRLDVRCDDGPPVRAATIAVTGIALGAEKRLIVGCAGLRPVPTLARGASLDRAVARPEASSGPRASDIASAPDRGPLGAALVAMAVVCAAAGVVLGWRGRNPLRRGATVTDAADPALPLVRLRRHRGG
jgi:hypothetical protein